jgi:branched-chain amino acid transport system permease protein
MAAPTAVADRRRGDARAEAMARLRQRVRLPLIAVPAGGVVGILGSYLYWTLSPVRVEGVPLTGRLADFGIGGVRTWSLLLALAVLVYGALVLRSRTRTSTQGEALVRLGVGLAVLPPVWALTLVLFLDVEVGRLGPGPWVTAAGGVLAWLGARSLLAAEPAPAPTPWARRSMLLDLAVVVVAELVAYGVFLLGIEVDDPGEFLGFFTALTALAATLSTLGVFKGLAGPFRRNEGVAIALLAVLLLLFPFTQEGNTFWIQVTAQAGLFVLAALGLNIVVGSAGLLDLGYVAFFGIGAYTAALTGNALLTNVNFHIPFLLVVFIVAPVVAAFFGVLLGAPTLRLRGDYLAIVTLGFGEIIRIFMNNLNDPINITNGPQGINLIDSIKVFGVDLAGEQGSGAMVAIGPWQIPSVNAYYFLFLLLTIATIFITARLQHSRLGRAWVAIREDEIAAKAMGINTRNVKLLAFSMGATFGGVAGAMFAAFQGFVSPESFSLTESIAVLAMVVLGGIGHIPGVVLGGLLLAALPEVLRHVVEPVQMQLFGKVLIEAEVLRQLLYGLALVLIMLVRPAGLWPSPKHEDRPDGDSDTKGQSSGVVAA